MLKYFNTIGLGLLLLTATSCKKSFLEITPKGSLIARTYSDYNLLMNGSNFYVYQTSGIYEPAMLMGDDVAAIDGYFNGSSGSAVARAIFRWDADIFLKGPDAYSRTDYPEFLRLLQKNIYLCNKIILETPSATEGTEQQKASLVAEARAQRAFINFQLINYFGKPYLEASAATDPGWPIITETEVAAKNFNRSSLKEIYDFIIKDLSEAIPHLVTTRPFLTRMTKGAAEALLGKVYLFMGRSQDALDMLNAAFTDISSMSTAPKLYDYNITFDSNVADGGKFLPINNSSGPNSPYNNITDITESVLAINSYADAYNGNNYGNNFLLLSQDAMELFDPSDWRLKFYTNMQTDLVTPVPSGLMRKYGKKYVRIGMELPELYLLRAEARARTNDLSGAISDVEYLRKNRMPAAKANVPGVIAGDKVQLLKFIFDERQREFAVEGYRWFDMRRLSIDPLFPIPSPATHKVYSSGGVKSSFNLDPIRLTLRIPNTYLTSNPGMVNNP